MVLGSTMNGMETLSYLKKIKFLGKVFDKNWGTAFPWVPRVRILI